MEHYTEFLPISRADMEARGWDQLDFVVVGGDAYVDHPSFGTAIISRLLEAEGYKVGVLAQPRYTDCEDFKRFGKPKYGFFIGGGNVDSMVSYLGSQNEMVVYVDPEADDATIQSVGNALSGTAGVSRVQYMSKEDVLNQYKGYMSDYAALLNEFENDNPFKANYRVSLSDLSQMETISKQFENISGVYSVTAPIEMTKTFVEVQQAVTKVGRGLVLVLMAVSIITVGTTIRLSVFARRREIEIMKYVGATNALVTLPFVIEGLTMGLLSGILTAAATIGGYAYIVQLSPTLGACGRCSWVRLWCRWKMSGPPS